MATTNKILISGDVSTLAFEAGRILEELLLESATKAARAHGESVITIEHLRDCLDQSFHDDLRTRLHERVNAETKRDAA